jgi:hypothetical protein
MIPDLSRPIADWLPYVWYRHNVSGLTLPSLCVGRLPTAFGRPWKWWIVETPAEEKALLAALARPVPMRLGMVDFQSGPDAAVSAPSSGPAVGALYAPPAQDWPWITLVRAPLPSQGLARGRYGIDVDMIESDALKRVERLTRGKPGISFVGAPRS